MSKTKSTYSGGHGLMLGLLALSGLVYWLRRPEPSATEPLGQLPG